MSKKSSEKNRVVVEYRIDAKYAPVIFCPSNAIEWAFWKREEYVEPQFRTMDGNVCKAVFLGTMPEDSERCDDICQRHWGQPFSVIRSIWIARLGTNLDSYWHLLKLEKI